MYKNELINSLEVIRAYWGATSMLALEKEREDCANALSLLEAFIKREALLNEKKESDKNNELFNKRIWNIDEVAEFLGFTKKHLYNLRCQGKASFFKQRGKRGKLYCFKEDVLEWVKGDFQ